MNTDLLRNIIDKVSTIDDETWEASRSFFHPRELKKNDYFLRQDEVCKHIGFIHSGYTRLFYNIDGIEITKDFNTEYSFCGSYASFTSGKPSKFNVVAMEPLEVQVIDRKSLLYLTDRYMPWQKFLRIAMEQMFLKKEDREALFLIASPREKYADLMERNPEWLNRIPLKHIASYLNVSPETLSRIRKKVSG